jgi:hypothetical protein
MHTAATERLGLGRCRQFLCLAMAAALSVLGCRAKSLSMHSASGALHKLVQRFDGREDGPGRNSHDDGEKQRFDYKFPTFFTREIAPA